MTEAADFHEEDHPREEHGKFTSTGGGTAKKTKKPSSKSKVKGTQSKNFKKAMNKVKPEVDRRFGDNDDYDRKRREMIDNLDGYPQHSSQLRAVGVKIKAPILRSHLSDVYPDAKWSVRTEYYSGGSSIQAGWKGGGGYPYGANEISKVYSDYGATDTMTDYFDTDNYVSLYDMREDKPEYDHGQLIYKNRGERFRDWARIRLDELGQYDMSNQWSSLIGQNFTEGDFTGFSGIDDKTHANLKGLFDEFVDQEKKEGGAAEPQEVKLATTPASTQQPSSSWKEGDPRETPVDPATGEPLERPAESTEPDVPLESKKMIDVPAEEPLPPRKEPSDTERAGMQMRAQKNEPGSQYEWQKGGESLDDVIDKLDSLEGDRKTEPTVGRGGRGTTDGKKINGKGVVDFEPNKNDDEKVWEFWQVDMETHEKVPNTTSDVITGTYGQAIDDYIADWNTHEEGSTVGYPTVQGKLVEEGE